MVGTTLMAASTESGIIAELNSRVVDAPTSTLVPIVVRKAAWVRGTMSVGGLALIDAGLASDMAPTAMIAPSPSAAPARASREWRERRHDIGGQKDGQGKERDEKLLQYRVPGLCPAGGRRRMGVEVSPTSRWGVTRRSG